MSRAGCPFFYRRHCVSVVWSRPLPESSEGSEYVGTVGIDFQAQTCRAPRFAYYAVPISGSSERTDFFSVLFSHYCFCRLPHWPLSSTTTSWTTQPGSQRRHAYGKPECCAPLPLAAQNPPEVNCHHRYISATCHPDGQFRCLALSSLDFTLARDTRLLSESDPAVITRGSGASVNSPAPARIAIHRVAGPVGTQRR